MATDLLLVKDGQWLKAAESISYDSLNELKQGQTYAATIRQPRNVRHHRKYFALLNIIHENQEQYATVKGLLDAIKIGIGHCDYIPFRVSQELLMRLIERGGMVYLPIPRSISFHSMDQAEFEDVYEKSIQYILSDIVPGLNRADLEREVLAIAS